VIHRFLSAISLSLFCSLIACSEEKFKADAPQGLQGAANQSGSGTNTSSPESSASSGTPDGQGVIKAEDEHNLKSCENAWGKDAPVRTKENVRVIRSTISVGSLGTEISDSEKTEKPKFVLIYSSITVGGAPEWNLLNPNGYYCIVSSINVGTVLTVNLDKSAHLADAKSSIDVGSKVEANIAENSINVGSQIKVFRK